MESRWNSSGIYVIVSGGFQSIIPYGMVESMWNIGGMESPKCLGYHPKHIPCGMGGIHLE